MRFLLFLSFLPAFLIALSVHESAHALMSKWLGDRCAEKQGRISLNPMRHLSALGTCMLFVVGFGWGKPVPVNLYNFKRPKFYYLLSSLAGPFSNILMCCITVALIYGLNLVCQTDQGCTNLSGLAYIAYTITWYFLYSLLYINVILAVFNLLPIPPLDGSKIWPCLIPKMRPTFRGKFIWLWFAILILLSRGDALGKVIDPVILFVHRFMPDMLNRQISMPSGFPEQMQAPPASYGAAYDTISDNNDLPSTFITTFFLEEPYPAQDFRTRLVEKMAQDGWLTSDEQNNGPKDANQWESKDVIEEDVEYKELLWYKRWTKDGDIFYVKLSYYSETEEYIDDDFLTVQYRYTKSGLKANQ